MEMTRIERLVDQGRGNCLNSGVVSISRDSCVRRGCSRASADDTGFCGPCLAWARGDEEVDPISRYEAPEPEMVMPYPPEPTEAWNDYLARARAST